MYVCMYIHIYMCVCIYMYICTPVIYTTYEKKTARSSLFIILFYTHNEIIRDGQSYKIRPITDANKVN